MNTTSYFWDKLKVLDRNGDGSVDINDFLDLFKSKTSAVAVDEPSLSEKRINGAWEKNQNVLDQLSENIRYKVQSGKPLADQSYFSRTDRKINSILGKLSGTFNDADLEEMRKQYTKLIDGIKERESVIADLHAKSALSAPENRNKIEKQISVQLNSLSEQIHRRDEIVEKYVDMFSVYGAKITSEQAEVLLSRIDADDVTKMTSVFAIIAGLTAKFGEAKSAGGESTEVAQKYYGMYIGLLELQEHIQSEYIDRMEKQYIPGISKIKSAADKLIAETRALKKAMPAQHATSYDANLGSQEFTKKVARIYEESLQKDLSSVRQAREIVRNLLKLAENTLKTVKVSAELVSLMKQSKGLYNEVMQLQTPDMIPFENLELKKEFEAVTSTIRKSM